MADLSRQPDVDGYVPWPQMLRLPGKAGQPDKTLMSASLGYGYLPGWPADWEFWLLMLKVNRPDVQSYYLGTLGVLPPLLEGWPTFRLTWSGGMSAIREVLIYFSDDGLNLIKGRYYTPTGWSKEEIKDSKGGRPSAPAKRRLEQSLARWKAAYKGQNPRGPKPRRAGTTLLEWGSIISKSLRWEDGERPEDLDRDAIASLVVLHRDYLDHLMADLGIRNEDVHRWARIARENTAVSEGKLQQSFP
jgi:hypothetical protein